MKRSIIIFLIIYCASYFFGQNEDLSYDLLREKFYPCIEGSANEKNLISYIENLCITNNFLYKITPVDNGKDIITNSYNLTVTINGSGKNLEELILVCPLNSYERDNEYHDNFLSLKILMDLMLSVRSSSFKKNIVFLFTGANESVNSTYEGLNFFIKSHENSSRATAFIINLLSENGTIDFSGSSNRKPIPLRMLQDFFAIDKNELDLVFNKREIYKSRFFLLDENKYDSFFINNGIPAVMFSNKNSISGKSAPVTPDYIERLEKYFFDWIFTMDNLFLPIDADYHYQYLKFFKYDFFLSEQTQIVIIAFCALLLIVSWFFFSIKKTFHFSLFIKGLPFFFLIYVINLTLSFLPLLLFIPIDFITGSERSYLNFPVIYFINIFFIPLFIIMILFEKIKKIYFPKHSDLYTYASAMFFIFNLFLFFIFDVSMAYIFLWAIIMIFISSYTGKRIFIKYSLYILSMIPFLILIYDISYFKNIDIIKNINPFLINLSFTLFVFPFILLFLGIDQFFRKINKVLLKDTHYVNLIIIVVAFTVIFSMVITAVYQSEKKVIYASYNYSESENSLNLSSNKIIGKIKIKKEGYGKSLNVLRSSIPLEIDNIKKPYEISLSNVNAYFNYNLLITSARPIKYINAFLKTGKESYPVESNYVFEKVIDLKKADAQFDFYKFLIPRNIGGFFDLKMSLLSDEYDLIIEVIYTLTKEKSGIEVNDENTGVVAVETFTEKFEIGKF